MLSVMAAPTCASYLLYLFLFVDFLMMAILTVTEVVPYYSFDCISLISDVEHLLMCLLAIWISSLEKNVYLDLLPTFGLGCLFFGC